MSVQSSAFTLLLGTCISANNNRETETRVKLGVYTVLTFFSLSIWSAGSELVDWLFSHVDGFIDRRDARRYACNLLKAGYIQHTVNKLTFSEQCYYIFGSEVCHGELEVLQTSFMFTLFTKCFVEFEVETSLDDFSLDVSSEGYTKAFVEKLLVQKMQVYRVQFGTRAKS
jgi:hypothetical protein